MRARPRRAIAGLGVASLVLSALCFAADGALYADPLLAVRLRIPIATQTLAVSVPEPSPSPKPKKRGLFGDGPIVLRGDGTYQLGLSRSSRNGLPLDYDDYATALQVTAERRTEQTSLSVSNSFGYGSGAAGGGTLVANYQTPKYGLSYGQLAGPADTQLEVGGLARGIGLSFPMRNGNLTYLAATATQQDDLAYRVYGIRRDWNGLGGYLSAAGYDAVAETSGGREQIEDFSYSRYGAKLSTQSELAVSSTRGVTESDDGAHVAAAFQADLQGLTTMSTLNIRYDPTGFQSLSGPIDGGLSADLAIRRHTNLFGDVGIDLAHIDDRLVDSNAEQHDDHLTLTGGRSWTHFGIQYVAGVESTRTDQGIQLQRTGALTLSQSFGKLSLFETLQGSSVASPGGNAAQTQATFGASHPLFGGSAAYQVARSESQGGFTSAGTGLMQSLSYRRNIGRKADATISETVSSSDNNGVPSRLLDTGLTLVRRLSSVVAVQIGMDRFRQTGLGAGSGTSFNASLVGPFGFGQPTGAYGKANPKLPAVIRGTVTYSTSATPFAYNQPSIRGFNNALVILDGGITQRTDASGSFEFHFVSQGTHTIRIDPATLPPGLVLDREYQSFQVLGGQTMTVQFNVGNFAGIAGTVVATDGAGVKHPLGNVGIAIDGIQAVTTTADGHYQVGRLSTGPHTVAIVDATVPSTVAFTDETKRTVTVAPGTQIPVDFVATTLGSIGGFVMAPADGAFGTPVGLKNVYVVAEPGDHAGITDDDGSYLLDNLPPGTYTLSVDPDTIPDGLSVLSGPDGPVTLKGGASVTGQVFHIGEGTKNVVYTFNDGKKIPIQVTLDPPSAPPGALVRVLARTAGKDLKNVAVESDVLGGLALRFDRRVEAWSGGLIVPQLAKGDYALTVAGHRADVADGTALLAVDPGIPLFTTRLFPAKPEPGHTVKVSLKTLAPVEGGDSVLFEDGYKVVLPKPNGRLFVFDIRLWRNGLPYTATVVTKRGQTYPLSLR